MDELRRQVVELGAYACGCADGVMIPDERLSETKPVICVCDRCRRVAVTLKAVGEIPTGKPCDAG